MRQHSFIVIEGMDGSGKTTLIRFLQRHLGTDNFHFTREPGGTPAAEAVRSILLDTVLSQNASWMTNLFGFVYARSHHLQSIAEWLKVKHVITDRFDGSTFAYQGHAQIENAAEREMFIKLFWKLRRAILKQSVPPTLYIYLDIPADVAKSRRAQDNSTTQTHFDVWPVEKYERQREGYKRFLSHVKRQGIIVVTIDATQPPEDIAQQTLGIIQKHCQ